MADFEKRSNRRKNPKTCEEANDFVIIIVIAFIRSLAIFIEFNIWLCSITVAPIAIIPTDLENRWNNPNEW